MTSAVHGEPPAALVGAAADAVQVSPTMIEGTPIEAIAAESLTRVVIDAPPGTLERRYLLAHGLRALAPDGELIALAPRQKGGARLGAELAAFGCKVRESARRHYRVCRCARPAAPSGLDAAIAAGAPRLVPSLGLWSQPGLFAWDRIDPGSALLLAQPWTPAGRGVDLGCGLGVLSLAALASKEVGEILLIDLDRRALDAAHRNIDDARASFLQHDLRRPPEGLTGLDFAVMNPPFHDGGAEDRALGRAFVATAAAMLKPGGVLRMTANVALPYESALDAHFSAVTRLAREGGYKVLEARR